MKIAGSLKSAAVWLFTMLLAGSLSSLCVAEKSKEISGETIDSGTFGVFSKGTRVASETFTIHQAGDESVVSSTFKTTDGSAAQSSELRMSGKGELRKYEWKELSPGKSQATVTPGPEALIERTMETPKSKPSEKPFLVPNTTSILDDYFFSHLEVLAWKYFAMTCHQQNGRIQCPVNQNVQFGTMNPHASTTPQVTVTFAGLDRIPIRGTPQELNRLSVKTDSSNWTLWLDDQSKLVRVAVGADNTEVVRD